MRPRPRWAHLRRDHEINKYAAPARSGRDSGGRDNRGGAGAAPAHATYPGRNGVIVFAAIPVAGGSADLWSVSRGSAATQITDTADPWEICPAFSADGRELAMCVVDGEATEIWTFDVDGSDERQLTDLGGWAIFPDWNRQGNRIVFSWASEPGHRHRAVRGARALRPDPAAAG